jgi:hypothetical protein
VRGGAFVAAAAAAIFARVRTRLDAKISFIDAGRATGS